MNRLLKWIVRLITLLTTQIRYLYIAFGHTIYMDSILLAWTTHMTCSFCSIRIEILPYWVQTISLSFHSMVVPPQGPHDATISYPVPISMRCLEQIHLSPHFLSFSIFLFYFLTQRLRFSQLSEVEVLPPPVWLQHAEPAPLGLRSTTTWPKIAHSLL